MISLGRLADGLVMKTQKGTIEADSGFCTNDGPRLNWKKHTNWTIFRKGCGIHWWTIRYITYTILYVYICNKGLSKSLLSQGLSPSQPEQALPLVFLSAILFLVAVRRAATGTEATKRRLRCL
jgi:hypothetical protein